MRSVLRIMFISLLALGSVPMGAVGTHAQEATPGATKSSAWAPVDCAEFQLNEVVTPIAECGYVTVQENRSNPDTNMIQLAVVRVKSPGATGSPIFVGTGGPGGTGLLFPTAPSRVLDITTVHAPLLANHEMIYYTQRGTQLAKPYLACPEYHAVASGFLTGLNGWTRQERDDQLLTTLTACKEGFEAQGVDLSAYTSEASADDVNDIREALGYDKIIFFGESYGTLLAQFVMRQHPDILESVVLDGVVPAEFPTYAKHNDVAASFQRMFDACAADANCAAAYPDLAGKLTEVVNAFNASPVPVQTTLPDGTEVTVTVNGDAVLEYLFILMVQGPPYSSEVPTNIYLLAQDPTSLLPAMVPSATTTQAELMQFTVNCADDPSVTIEEFDVPGQPEAFQEYVYSDGIRYVIACNLLGLTQLPDSSDEPVKNDIPVLVINGSIDPATPATSGELVASYLPQVQTVTVTGGGHVQWRIPCVVGIMASFLADPGTPVDQSCLPDAPYLQAPFEATFSTEDGTASISLTMPAGFTEVGPGQYQNQTGLTIALAALPADMDATAALVDGLAPVTTLDPSLVVDGAPVAGLPSKTVSLDIEFSGVPFAVDAWAFSNETATYRVIFLAQPPTGSQLRSQYPSLLDLVTIAPGSVSAEETCETRTLDAFQSVHIGGIGEMTITQGDTQSVQICAASDSYLLDLETEVKNNELHVTNVTGKFGQVVEAVRDSQIKYTIVVPKLVDVYAEDGIALKIEGFSSDPLVLSMHNKATLETSDLTVPMLTVDLNDGAEAFNVSGTVETLILDLDDQGEADLLMLDVTNVEGQMDELSKARVRFTGSLTVQATDLATIEYMTEGGTVDVQSTRFVTVRELPFEPMAA